jgi:DNA repair protein RecO (recombination protein O)
MIRKTDALVLRCLRYSNSSLIVDYYTERFGQVSVVAKGARKPPRKRTFHRPPEPFACGELVYYAPRRSDLGTQSEWSEYDDHHSLVGALPALRAATRVAEVTLTATRGAELMPDLYTQARLTLAALNAIAAIPPVNVDILGLIVLHYDLRLLGLTGHSPWLESCASCGGALVGRWLGLAADEGGMLCGDCYRQHRHAPADVRRQVMPVPPDAALTAQVLQHCDIDVLGEIELSRRSQRALRAAMDLLLTTVLHRDLRCFAATRKRWQEARIRAKA